jgi:hypothetical protein
MIPVGNMSQLTVEMCVVLVMMLSEKTMGVEEVMLNCLFQSYKTRLGLMMGGKESETVQD